MLVSLDTLRADRVGAYGHADAHTPNMDAFAGEAILFERAFSQASQTAPSHASMFSSNYPSELGSRGQGSSITSPTPFLAEILSIYGYQTAAFVAGGDLSPERGLNVGFATYTAAIDFGSLYHTMRPALTWLKQSDPSRPFFLFVHGYDAHPPYLKPSPFGYLHADKSYAGLGQTAALSSTRQIVDGNLVPDFAALLKQFSTKLRPRDAAGRKAFEALSFPDGAPVAVAPEDLAHVSRVYDGAVSYADAMFGILMAGLEAQGVLEKAVVVLMSDHGEQLGEHGLFWHGSGLEDEETHVVLMVRLPGGVGGGRRVSGLTELVDLLPTIVELAGAQPPAGIHGRSLVPALRGEPWVGRSFVHAQTNSQTRSVSVRGEIGRLTFNGLAPASRYLADVVEASQIGGPGLVVSGGISVAEGGPLRTEMVGWTQALKLPDATGVQKLSPALKATLEANGYWGMDK